MGGERPCVFEDMRKGEEARTGNIMDGGYAEFAFEEEAERRLWDMSCEMVGELTETECLSSVFSKKLTSYYVLSYNYQIAPHNSC